MREAPPSPSWFALDRRVQALASHAVVMPVDELRLSAEAASLQDALAHLAAIMAWARHPNFHVRRVGVNTMRRLEPWGVPGVLELLLERLSDEHGWVRLDAARALAARAGNEPEVMAALSKLSAGRPLPTVEEEARLDIDDEDLMARVEAARALEALRSPART